MSFHDDLRRNRAAFAQLSTGSGEVVESSAAPRSGFDEGGFVPEARFLQNRAGEATALSAGLAPQQGAAAQAGPSGPAAQTPRPNPQAFSIHAPQIPAAGQDGALSQPKVYRLGDSAGAESAAVGYPALPGPQSAAEQEDLLEALVRRTETAARRYPQEIGRAGDGAW